MTQKEKELLLQDLCARLPYGVKVDARFDENTLLTREMGLGTLHDFMFNDIKVKPYLRPLSNMTEEEKKELQKITNTTFYASSSYISNSNTPIDDEWHTAYNNFVTNVVCNKLISWLDKKHFDHRTDEEEKTLIENGLAIPVTEKNNPYEN